jgi:hypothetical protein
MSAEWPVQAAIFTALNGNSPLKARIAAIHDFAPQTSDGGSAAAFPYVEIGVIAFAAYDTHTERGHDFTARIHTWSRSGSVKECKEIQGLIYSVLHRGSLTISGHYLINLERETSDVMREQSGAFHGVCEYRGLVGKTP